MRMMTTSCLLTRGWFPLNSRRTAIPNFVRAARVCRSVQAYRMCAWWRGARPPLLLSCPGAVGVSMCVRRAGCSVYWSCQVCCGLSSAVW
jgi:hypothetical protein